MKAKTSSLKIRFHNPNSAEVSSDYILKVLIDANIPKADSAIRNAKMREAGIENQLIRNNDRSA